MYVLYIDDTGYARAHYDTCRSYTSRAADNYPTGCNWTTGYNTVADAHAHASQQGIAQNKQLTCGRCHS